MPQLNYILIDLSKIPDNALLGLRPTRLVNALVTMKHCYEPEYHKNNPDIIFRLGGALNASDSGKIFLTQLIQYFTKMTQFSPIEKQSFIENKIDPIMQRKFKSTWDMLLEEGMEKGMEKGKLAQLKLTIQSLINLTPDISDKEISVITCADLETIQQIRLEILAENG